MAFANSLSYTLCSTALVPTTTTQFINYPPSLFCTSSSSSSSCSSPSRLSLLPHHHHHLLRRQAPATSIRAPNKLLSSVALQNQVEATRREEDEMEELVEAIKGGINSMGADEGLLEALELVDLIERMGISRFFQEEINEILKNTFLKWDERCGLDDPATTVLAFRLLRLHGYSVSAGVIENLRGADGKFSSFSIESPAKISGMLNLHRCWQTGFPSEAEIMEEVEEFSTSQLKKALLEGDPSFLKLNNLGDEIKYALTYPRRYNLLRLESRSIVRQLWPTTGYKQKCLQLAKHDLSMLQKLHKQEIEALEKWWEEVGPSNLGFFSRSALVKSYFSVSAAIFEPEFAAFRIAFAKGGCLATLVDDLFDSPKFGVDGLSRFTNSFLRWDKSELEDFPEHKVVFTTLQNEVVDWAEQSSKVQGRDLFPLIKDVWDETLLALSKEAEWRNMRHVPTWDEYIRVGLPSVYADTCVWCAFFLIDHKMTDDILRCIGPKTRFMHLVALVGRLCNDLATFRREEACGQMASTVNCYLRDHPDKSLEEAAAAIDRDIVAACRELEWELFKSRATVPEFCARAVLNFARTMSFVYKRADAFSSFCDEEYEARSKDYFSGSTE